MAFGVLATTVATTTTGNVVFLVGLADGVDVGAAVGELVGLEEDDGVPVGRLVGVDVGAAVGEVVGLEEDVGALDGEELDGATVGIMDGEKVLPY